MEEFIGSIKLVAFNFAPRGWAFCNGQLLAIARNSALFSLLGATYGGDGKTTFALPDLRGRVALGMGQGPGRSDYRQGETGGTETTQLIKDNIPAHSHPAKLSVSPGNAAESKATPGSAIATPGYPDKREFKATLGYNGSTPEVALNNETITIGSTGSGVPFDNRQPYLALNYIICLQGIFPSRG